MQKNVCDLLSSTWEEGSNSSTHDQHSTQIYAEKKLKLFGFELHPCADEKTNHVRSTEGDGSVNSSSPPTIEKINLPADLKKFECEYCFKEFISSQALGGHQNAHKKERSKKKRLQSQARSRARVNYYLQPYIHYKDFHGYYDTDQLIESSISFSRYDDDDDDMLSFRDSCNFTLTHVDHSSRGNYTIKPSPRPVVDLKQKYAGLDLQLSLSSNSIM